MIDDALLEDAESYARERLSDKRYAHTLRVAKTAERLAKLHSLDPERAHLAGNAGEGGDEGAIELEHRAHRRTHGVGD